MYLFLGKSDLTICNDIHESDARKIPLLFSLGSDIVKGIDFVKGKKRLFVPRTHASDQIEFVLRNGRKTLFFDTLFTSSPNVFVKSQLSLVLMSLQNW